MEISMFRFFFFFNFRERGRKSKGIQMKEGTHVDLELPTI